MSESLLRARRTVGWVEAFFTIAAFGSLSNYTVHYRTNYGPFVNLYLRLLWALLRSSRLDSIEPGDWIERQLAHAEPNRVRATYNHAEHLVDRARMMQQWADLLSNYSTENK